MLLDVLGGVHDLLAPPIPKERKEIGKKRKKIHILNCFSFGYWI